MQEEDESSIWLKAVTEESSVLQENSNVKIKREKGVDPELVVCLVCHALQEGKRGVFEFQAKESTQLKALQIKQHITRYHSKEQIESIPVDVLSGDVREFLLQESRSKRREECGLELQVLSQEVYGWRHTLVLSRQRVVVNPEALRLNMVCIRRLLSGASYSSLPREVSDWCETLYPWYVCPSRSKLVNWVNGIAAASDFILRDEIWSQQVFLFTENWCVNLRSGKTISTALMAHWVDAHGELKVALLDIWNMANKTAKMVKNTLQQLQSEWGFSIIAISDTDEGLIAKAARRLSVPFIPCFRSMVNTTVDDALDRCQVEIEPLKTIITKLCSAFTSPERQSSRDFEAKQRLLFPNQESVKPMPIQEKSWSSLFLALQRLCDSRIKETVKHLVQRKHLAIADLEIRDQEWEMAHILVDLLEPFHTVSFGSDLKSNLSGTFVPGQALMLLEHTAEWWQIMHSKEGSPNMGPEGVCTEVALSLYIGLHVRFNLGSSNVKARKEAFLMLDEYMACGFEDSDAKSDIDSDWDSDTDARNKNRVKRCPSLPGCERALRKMPTELLVASILDPRIPRDALPPHCQGMVEQRLLEQMHQLIHQIGTQRKDSRVSPPMTPISLVNEASSPATHTGHTAISVDSVQDTESETCDEDSPMQLPMSVQTHTAYRLSANTQPPSVSIFQTPLGQYKREILRSLSGVTPSARFSVLARQDQELLAQLEAYHASSAQWRRELCQTMTVQEMRHMNSNPMDWWLSRRSQFPLLFQLARRYLSLLCFNHPKKQYSWAEQLSKQHNKFPTECSIKSLIKLRIAQHNYFTLDPSTIHHVAKMEPSLEEELLDFCSFGTLSNQVNHEVDSVQESPIDRCADSRAITIEIS